MKKILLSLLVLMLTCQLTAQQYKEKKRSEAVAIGIRVGGTLPNYYYSENADLNALPFEDNILKRVSPMFGLQVEIPLLKGYMYVAPEASFTIRGDNRVFMSETWNDMVHYQAKVNYLEACLPISVAVPVTSWLKPYVFAAPSFSLALPTVGPFISEFSQDALNSAFTEQHVAVDSSNMAAYDYGLTAGAGLRFTIDLSSFLMVVKLEGGYHMGFRNTYSALEIADQAQAVNVNAYNITWKRLNRGIEAAVTIAIPLDFHSGDDCFYWSEVENRKNKNRGMYGF